MKSKREEREAVLGDQQGRVGHFSTRGLVCPQSKGRLRAKALVVAIVPVKNHFGNFCALG